MRETPLDIKNESGLFQHLNTLLAMYIYMERVEPANESGFPDIHFNWIGTSWTPEGTIELKFFKANEKINLNSAKMRGNQKAAHLDYFNSGGKRRFVFAYQKGQLYVWNTEGAALAIRGQPHGVRVYGLQDLDDTSAESRDKFVEWLKEVLA
jgi:hypothetical protein